MNRKLFLPHEGETLLGVLRPSLWTVVPRSLVSGALIVFPFVVLFPLISLGPLGLLIGAGMTLIGLYRMSKTRNRWLYSALYITDKRVVDVYLRGQQPYEEELVWQDIDEMTMRRSLFGWMFGFGTIRLEGTEDAEMSIELRAIPNPKVVQNFLLEVQCHTTDKAFARTL